MLHEDLVSMSTNFVYNMPLPGETVTIPNGSNVTDVKSEYIVLDTYSGDPQAILVASTQPPYESAIIFEGTSSGNDWITDSQLVGDGIPKQFTDSVIIFDGFQRKIASGAYNGYGFTINPVSYVAGNSLGGGLANYVATQRNNLTSVTINPAVIPDDTQIISNSEYKNYISKNEPLNRAQEGSGLKEGRVPGEEVIIHSGGSSMADAVRSHKGQDDSEDPEAAYMIPRSLLTGNAIGNEEPIVINPESLTVLEEELSVNIGDVEDCVIGELNSAKQLLHTEHRAKGFREENAKIKESDIIKEYIFSGINIPLEQLANVSLWDVIDKLCGFGIENIPFVGKHIKVENILCTAVGINDEIDDVDARLRAFILSIDVVIDNEIPKIFEGYNLPDGTPLQLKKYVELILDNLKIYTDNLGTFRKQVSFVKETMISGDEKYFADSESSYINEYINIHLDDKTIENSKNTLDNQFEDKFNAFLDAVSTNIDVKLKELIESLRRLLGAYNDSRRVDLAKSIANIKWKSEVEVLERVFKVIQKIIDYFDNIYESGSIANVIRENKLIIKNAIFAQGRYEEFNQHTEHSLSRLLVAKEEYEYLAVNIDANSGTAAKRLKQIFNLIATQSEFIIGQIEDIVVTGEDYD